MRKLVVLVAFDLDADGNLNPAFRPREMPSEILAKSVARNLASRHAGVLAWSRDVDVDRGEYGQPTELARYGLLPDLVEDPTDIAKDDSGDSG